MNDIQAKLDTETQSRAEEDFITLMLLAPEWVGDVSWLQPSDFHYQICGEAWQRLLDTVRGGDIPNPFDYPQDFQSYNPPALVKSHAINYAERIANTSLARRGLLFGSELAKACYRVDTDAIRSLARKADQTLSASSYVQSNEIQSAALELKTELLDPATIAASIKRLGLTKLDDCMAGGVDASRLMIVCGRPGAGKTAILCQMLDGVTARGDVAVFFSEEMTTKQVLIRIATRRARVNWDLVRRNAATPDQLSAIAKEIEAIEARSNLFVYGTINRKNHTTDEIADTVERIAHKAGRVDWVMGDHLRLFADKNENEVMRLGVISGNFKQIANRFSCRSIVAAQLSRAPEMRTDKRPTLSDLRDSGQIEENADIVLGLYRERYYDPDADLTVELNLIKHRDGDTTIAKMIFLPEIGSFEVMTYGN